MLSGALVSLIDAVTNPNKLSYRIFAHTRHAYAAIIGLLTADQRMKFRRSASGFPRSRAGIPI